MKGIFYFFKEPFDYELVRKYNLDTVFIYCPTYNEGLSALIVWLKSLKLKVWFTFDCFSGGVTEKRFNELLSEINTVKSYGVDGVCLDAVRFWEPSLSDVNARCSKIASMVSRIKSYCDTLRLKVSACTKSEWFNGVFWSVNTASKIYGQDYTLLSNHVDVFMPMAYKKIYAKFPWNLINWFYNPKKISESIQEATSTVTVPILWEDNIDTKYYTSFVIWPE